MGSWVWGSVEDAFCVRFRCLGRLITIVVCDLVGWGAVEKFAIQDVIAVMLWFVLLAVGSKSPLESTRGRILVAALGLDF